MIVFDLPELPATVCGSVEDCSLEKTRNPVVFRLVPVYSCSFHLLESLRPVMYGCLQDGGATTFASLQACGSQCRARSALTLVCRVEYP